MIFLLWLSWLFVNFNTNLFPKNEKSRIIIWSEKVKKKWKQRTDDYGIESITNCLYVKCKAKKYYEHRKKTWITKNHQLLHFSFQIWYYHLIWIFAPKVGHFRDMIDFYYGRFFWRQFFAFLGGKMQKFVYAFEMLLFWEREGFFSGVWDMIVARFFQVFIKR